MAASSGVRPIVSGLQSIGTIGAKVDGVAVVGLYWVLDWSCDPPVVGLDEIPQAERMNILNRMIKN